MDLKGIRRTSQEQQAARRASAQHKDVQHRGAWLARAGSFDLPPGSVVLMLMLHHPMCLFPSCFKRPNGGTESPDPFSETLSRPAGSGRQ